MTTETIKEIIEIEKEIQARINAEGEKIAHWLADQEAEIAHGVKLGMESLRRDQAEEEETMLALVRERTAAILAAAELEADRSQALSRAELESLVRRHLRRILPVPGQ